MSIDSKIYLKEEVPNKDRKFGSTNSYFPVMVKVEGGNEEPALFTVDQINQAMERAKSNPEDLPKDESNLFSWLFS